MMDDLFVFVVVVVALRLEAKLARIPERRKQRPSPVRRVLVFRWVISSIERHSVSLCVQLFVCVYTYTHASDINTNIPLFWRAHLCCT